jgi:DMSO/TMAO reductase YedYZ molybdopterin-dependent catalytic subunit
LRSALASLGTASLAGCDRLSDNATWSQTLLSAQRLNQAAQRVVAGPNAMAQEFAPADVAAHFRPNGTLMPQDPQYRALLGGGFKDWALRVDGRVRQPASYSLEQLRAMPSRTQITRHDCVEGWSSIGKWKGVPLAHVLAQVQPTADARYAVFHCADSMDTPAPGAPDSRYYESIDLDEAVHPQTVLAYELNDQVLPVQHGAPLRLRVERQLGYKQAKFLMRIEFVDSFAGLRGGRGGYWEDHGYEWYAGI